MTAVTQTITPAQPQYALINQSWINVGTGYSVLNLLKDRTTFVGASGLKMYTSTNVDTSATPTWTQIADFANPRGGALVGLVELPNGEVLAIVNDTSYAPNLGHVYVSSGWSVNKSTATWTKTLDMVGGAFTGAYCGHDWVYGNDGTVIMSESGNQTLGGVGNVTADLSKARRVFMSKDFGKTWSQIFDIYTFGQAQGQAYPAGVHIHGVAYDQDWGRIWVAYGDNTGDGKLVAGTGYAQVVYSDDGGATWTKLPTPKYWSNAGQGAMTLQMITIVPFNNCIVMTSDVTEPVACLVFPKLGYRTLGDPHASPGFAGGSVDGVPRKVIKNARFPTIFGGCNYVAQTGTVTWRMPVTDDDGFTWSRITGTIPLQSPTLSSTSFLQAFGPTLNGKVVCVGGLYVSNDNTKKTMVADLVMQ